MPIPPAPLVGGGRNDKLVGNTPLIFKGERSRAEEFITQWQLYEGVNITNDLMNQRAITVGILHYNPIQLQKSGQSDFAK
jgi:hypothetical protein